MVMKFPMKWFVRTGVGIDIFGQLSCLSRGLRSWLWADLGVAKTAR
jgi:hypothetical protein